ncbi:MAG: hypothetical protein Q8882_06710, partial [Bacillota bacterium]|nr:hypothetical protein [Bacillota bacterium]
HVSVAFWLCFNECQLTEEFLKASVKVCRDNDRTRLISGANNMPKEYVKEVFPGSGVDFYTMHPYDSSSRLMREYAAYLTDKPLIFTEWGGLCVTDRLDTLKEEIYAIVEMEKNSDDKSQVLAGQSIWFWSEIYEFGRGLPACREGILKEGLFDMYRKPNLIAPYFKKFFEEARNAKPKEPEFNIYDIEAEGTTRAVGLSKAKCKKAAYERAINDALAPIEWMNTPKQVRKMKTGPVLPIDVKKIGELNVSLAKVPMVSSREDNVVIPINADALSIYIIGNVGMPKGFPIGGEYGEDAAKYIVEFEGGNKEEFILKNGYDITTAYAVYGPSRINPVAANSKRVIKYCNDIEFEEYVINLHEIKFEAHRKIEKLTVEAIGGYDILTYGVSIRVK